MCCRSTTLNKEADTLQSFYASVQERTKGIDNAAGKQKIVVELYDKFFRNAFPKMTERLGIVYTPVEVVDFIIHSVNHTLQTEFGQTLGSKGVHIIDPFTGTGTFITRLMQSGLITPEQLPYTSTNRPAGNGQPLLQSDEQGAEQREGADLGPGRQADRRRAEGGVHRRRVGHRQLQGEHGAQPAHTHRLLNRPCCQKPRVSERQLNR